MSSEWKTRFQAAYGHEWPGVAEADPDRFDVALSSISLLDGSTIAIPPTGVTVVVGSNNAGKSTLLREVVTEISQPPGRPRAPRMIVADATLTKSGSPAEVLAWLGDHSAFVVQGTQAVFHTSRGTQLHPRVALQAWTHGGNGLGELAQAVVHYSHAQDRFNFGGAVETRTFVSEPPVNPLHSLQDSRETLDKLSDITEDVFGHRMTLDALGRTIVLRVGALDIAAPPVDNISSEYREAMAALPMLEMQGDGMRGFLGQILPILTSTCKIVALDEPEAFLHPPQAYGLGQHLGRLSEAGKTQVLIATHDRSLLAGLLDSGVDVSVVRLSRKGTTTSAHQLDAEKVTELWRDPVLKYTNVLDGLFHRAVVLAEAEGDCAYFAASLDAATEDPAGGRDLLFVPTGGKAGMPRVASALTAVGVPVVATADLDLLNNEATVRRLVESLRGEWDEQLRSLWKRATNDLRSRREPATIGDVKTSILSVLSGLSTDPFTPELETQVKAQVRTRGSRWEPMKEFGTAAFKGDAHVALEELLSRLDSAGVVLVRAGELERLAREVSTRKGPDWLPEALKTSAHRNAETQAHVARIQEAARLASEDSRHSGAR